MKSKNLLSLLQSAYPDFNVVLGDGKDYSFGYSDESQVPEQIIVLDINGFSITNPKVSECGRFEVDAIHYGISEEHANLIVEHNKCEY